MASNTSYQPFSPGNIFFIDGSKTSGKIKRVKEKRGRIMNRKPTFNSSIVDASSFFQPALATNYQAQVTELYKNRQIDHQLPTSTKFSHIYTKDNPVSSSFSVINPVRPVRNRLSNFEYASPELHHFEQDQPSGLHPLHPYSFDQTPPERKVNYQIHIKPVHQSKKNIERPSKQIIQTSTVCNNVGSSHFLSKVTPLKCTPSVQFRPPKPIFGFRPNFYPFPLESNFLNKRGPFQKSGSFQLPSTPIHASNFHGNFQHSYSTGGIHLPRYGYLIFNPKRGPPYYIIPEEGPFQFGIDNEYLPHLESHQRSVIKPRKFL
ncbi:unnamed protein product [Allacma fusca]|uniref:Uncharacterized protein n=1 Tax=Allacma fusca TaxID=39272 RepID=A0A8J2K9H0_9HEXA|nr:unnamed protein product [Allacma fusca]